jgi:hypothetical protein
LLTTELLGFATQVVDSAVDSSILRVEDDGSVAAGVDLIVASTLTVKSLVHLLLNCGIEKLKTIGVVSSNLNIGGPLNQTIDAGVDEHYSVQLENNILFRRQGSILDELVLLLEIGEHSWSIPPTVRLGREAEAIVVGFVFRKFLKPRLEHNMRESLHKQDTFLT